MKIRSTAPGCGEKDSDPTIEFIAAKDKELKLSLIFVWLFTLSSNTVSQKILSGGNFRWKLWCPYFSPHTLDEQLFHSWLM